MPLRSLDKPVLYSTMTKLAFNINKTYYKNLHYMWCTPYFGIDYNSPTFTVPPSSSPIAIYQTLQNEINGSDCHDTKIRQNRMGIRRGAKKQLSRGVIDNDQYDEIIAITKKAKDIQLLPLLCIIPRVDALKYFHKVDIKYKANPLSAEYILVDLPESAFDIIRIG